ncbi:helix-hairpin-helix domain-containing protein [Haloferax sp. MBLA0076]|uniref:Helix-hairpin-helix domain-containing protein n=1 Tax=Haloferax litoreum TaxID=2666140 RepID=A0A6A8GHP4_9EURY|nr:MULTISPECIES: helix-hairpin-helix domain-containing protein [Haloferax]KAB1194333.1 helix-hairpin-helix domain-containing protein [Haloferax sp. CBA1148]MRX22894.1 helix-hairpin-helix domain-containing protein [Haloferax litoreum]
MTGENDTGTHDEDGAEGHQTDTAENPLYVDENLLDTDGQSLDADGNPVDATGQPTGPEGDPTNTDEAIENLLKPRADDEQTDAPSDLQDLKFVGPATADSLESAGIDVESILDGQVCYRDLVEAGTNPGVAAKIRRWHSLSWSFNSGDDLDRRSSQVRGLGDDERAWVAASSGEWKDAADEDEQTGDWTPTGETDTPDDPTTDGDWTPSGTASQTESPTRQGDWTPRGQNDASADGSGDAIAAEAAWRERSKPTPLTTLDGIGEEDAERLAEAGVRSVRRLATADPEHVADALKMDHAVISEWKSQARDATE